MSPVTALQISEIRSVIPDTGYTDPDTGTLIYIFNDACYALVGLPNRELE